MSAATSRMYWLVALLVWLQSLLATPASAVVNGTVTSEPRYQAVVYVNGCTGTFVHPYFVLTARHCFDTTTDGPPGPNPITVNDGVTPTSGTSYLVDYVYFARREDWGGAGVQDVALLRTTTPFTGTVIPVYPMQDLPRGPEDFYCPRWEFTWPTMVGYSPNAGADFAARRVGKAFAECDLEEVSAVEGTSIIDNSDVFKVDGHGRPVTGSRGCKGDSGGPALWDTGFGGMAVGGVLSTTDTFHPFSSVTCPSERGESGYSFIPLAFLNRVAANDPRCAGKQTWSACTQPEPYGGRNLRYLGTVNDECGLNLLTVPAGGGASQLRAGDIAMAEVGTNRFNWFCDSSQEWTTAPAGTNFVVVKRGLTDRRIIWDAYQRGFIVPGVVGLQQATAVSNLRSAGIGTVVVVNVLSSAPLGQVVSQSVANGTFVPPGATVSIGVSTAVVAVPDVLGMTRAAATSTIRGAGLSARVLLQKRCIEPGTVLVQSPSIGSHVAAGSLVTITVDSGSNCDNR